MTDTFALHSVGLESPATRLVAITPDDAANVARLDFFGRVHRIDAPTKGAIDPDAALGAVTLLAAAAAALALAWTTRPPGPKALLWQAFYLAEAAVLARHLERSGVTHLHNHFGDSSGSVAIVAATLADIPFSLTLNGPTVFFKPHRWRLDAKIAQARFAACISRFCQAQAMIFVKPEDWPKLQIVHYGVHPDRYGRGDRAPGKRLIFVGRLAAVKGVRLLLDALATGRDTHPDATLTLAGDEPERAATEGHAASSVFPER